MKLVLANSNSLPYKVAVSRELLPPVFYIYYEYSSCLTYIDIAASHSSLGTFHGTILTTWIWTYSLTGASMDVLVPSFGSFSYTLFKLIFTH